MNVTICTSKQKIQSSLLQSDDKSFQFLKWTQSNGKDLTIQSGGEEFKFPHTYNIDYLGHFGYMWFKYLGRLSKQVQG